MHNFICAACTDRTLVITAEERPDDSYRPFLQFVVACGNGHELVPTVGMEIRADED